jgi:hypothetical protein
LAQSEVRHFPFAFSASSTIRAYAYDFLGLSQGTTRIDQMPSSSSSEAERTRYFFPSYSMNASSPRVMAAFELGRDYRVVRFKKSASLILINGNHFTLPSATKATEFK